MCSGPALGPEWLRPVKPQAPSLTAPLGVSDLINSGNYEETRAHWEKLAQEGGGVGALAQKKLKELDARVGKTPADPLPPPPAATGVFVPQIGQRAKVGAAELKMPTLPVPQR